MFKSKKDIDRHVRGHLAKLNENEKKYRGFIIAKLYFKINEYAIAANYVSEYLSVNKNKAPAYNLLGQCLMKLNKTDQALESFQKSLQLDPKQPDLLVEVCKIFLSKNSLENSVAEYWCNLAESENVQDISVFTLRLKLSEKENLGGDVIENRILSQIVNNPNDVDLRIHYVQQLIKQSKVVEAFKYVLNLEVAMNDQFVHSMEWYNNISILLLKFKTLVDVSHNWEFFVLQTISLEKQLCLSFRGSRSHIKENLAEIENALFDFDQHLHKLAQVVQELCNKELAANFLKHFQGQLCLHIASFLFEMEIHSDDNWKDTSKKVFPLLFFAYHNEPLNLQQQWIDKLEENDKKLVNLLHSEGNFRCCQAGHTILSYAIALTYTECKTSDRIEDVSEDAGFENISSIDILNEIKECCSKKTWRVKIYRDIFNDSEKILKISKSYFTSCDELLDPVLDFPTAVKLENYEEKAQKFKPYSLSHMTYLWLDSDCSKKSLKNFSECKNFSTNNLSCCSAETLNTLDIETFLYASVIHAKRSIELNIKREGVFQFKNQLPNILPFANIHAILNTETQSNWWKLAHDAGKGVADGKLAETRSSLKYGIEAVRGINEQKLDLIVILKLAKILYERSEKTQKISEKNFIELRAFNLFKYSLQILKKRSKDSLEPQQMLFCYPLGNCVSNKKILHALIEDAVQYVVKWYFRKSEFQNCIELLSGLKIPLAKYYVSEAYKNLEKFVELRNQEETLSDSYLEDCSNSGDCRLLITNSESKLVSHRNYNKSKLEIENSSDTNDHVDVDKILPEIINSGVTSLHSSKQYQREEKLNPKISSIENLENLIKSISETLKIVKDEVIDNIRPTVNELRTDIADLKEKINMIEEKRTLEKSETLGPADLNEYLLAAASLQSEIYPPQQTQPSYPVPNIENIHETQATNLQQQILNTYKNPLFHPNYMPTNNFPQYSSPLQPKTCQNSFYRANQINPAWTLANQHPQYDSLGTHPSGNLHNPGLEVQKINDFLNYLNQSSGIYPPQPKSPNALNVSTIQQQSQAAQCAPVFNSNLWSENLFHNTSIEKGQPEVSEIGKTFSTPFLNTLTPTTLNTSIVPLSLTNTFIFSSPTTTTPTLTIPTPMLSSASLTANINGPINKSITSPVSETETSKSTIQNSSEYKEDIEYDPRPDFQPIIPLPAEITVSTGEENEEILFSHKAKLFRFIDKEWKERGCGDIKILKNNDTGKGRVLMRRDITHKICANHTITGEIDLVQPSSKKDEKSYIWAAHDYADEELKLEKFCVRFKQAETAQEFYNTFIKVRDDAKQKEKISLSDNTAAAKSFNLVTQTNTEVPSTIDKQSPFKGLNLSNLATSSTKPFEFLNKTENPIFPKIGLTNSKTGGVFDKSCEVQNADSSFDQSATDRLEDDYVPTAEFKPVIALPDLVDTETGEENEVIVFEHRAKLLRHDKQSSEWKERGIGNIKILQARDNPNKVRLVMRREKVQKLCCNQNILKETKFIYPKNAKTKNSLIWINKDYSERELNTETLSLRFKTEETCKQFLDTILKLQQNMEVENPSVETEKTENNATESKANAVCTPDNMTQNKSNVALTEGFGDKFKPKLGSWSCNSCYVQNSTEVSSCVACSASKEETKDGSLRGFGDKFKPKVGSWSCNTCCVQNSADVSSCVACSTPKEEIKDGTLKGFGDKFKPKVGSWSCKSCYVQNSADVSSCVACSAPKEEMKDGILKGNLFAPSIQPSTFTFGFNNNIFNASQNTTSKFSFGFGSNLVSTSTSNPFDLKSSVANSIPTTLNLTSENKIALDDKLVTVRNSEELVPTSTCDDTLLGNNSDINIFNSNNVEKVDSSSESCKNDEKSSDKSDNFNFGKSKFNFNFVKTKSPGKMKGPVKCITKIGDDADVSGEDAEEDDAEEEENNAYFTPLVHLEKVETKTGEENEDVLYCHRAKLYRFVDKEWKERGLGDVKILKHKLSNKLRVVMRREQIHKICLNHLLNSEVEYKAKDDKSWLFAVNDYSEGEIEFMQCCIRFKTEDVAKEFIEEIKNAVSKYSDSRENEENPNELVTHQGDQITDSSDQKEKCKGCRGCSPDSFVFKDYKNLESSEQEREPLPLQMPTREIAKEKSAVLKQSSFATPILPTKSIFNGENSKPFSLKSIETGKSIFENAGNIFEKTSTVSSFPFDNPFTMSSVGNFNFLTASSIKEPLSENNSKEIIPPDSNTKPFNETSVIKNFSFTSLSNKDNKLEDKNNPIKDDLKTKTETFINKESGTFVTKESRNLVDFASLAKSSGSLLDFASLAKSSANIPVEPNENKINEFQGLTQVTSFDNFLKPKLNKSANDEQKDESNRTDDDNNFDPYYKPIIDLPKAVVTSTGEEEETKLFGERATLFRYDSTDKQWKERGVGEIKILHHPTKGTYRIILRREQVHKLVLNHTIPKYFALNEMTNSVKSFCWSAINYADENPQLEKLAIRFKNTDLAKKFQQKINECLAQLETQDD
ncbi:E3 SUMO-protein ligase RanBP2 [Condylostylus longicornis]|uniref:E3 SUMO-protein ligase RanBP2 n=1 Tax=Condylostylus longicornis TaxID=2530218 RepID=UPI00244E5A5C|nr:E3 SUMO-protein ligase RanBP2 [Condylostylus longicornis]